MTDRTQRRYNLIFKASRGALTPAEEREKADLDKWWQQALYGRLAPEAAETAAPAAPGIVAPFTRAEDFVKPSGSPEDVADIEAQASAGRSYASLSDWADDMRTAQGRAQIDTALNMVSPTRGLMNALKTGWNVARGNELSGYDPALGNTGWGYDIEFSNNAELGRGSVTDPTTGLGIDFSGLGHEHGGGETDVGSGFGLGTSEGDTSAHGGGDFGGGTADGDDADGNDTDPGGDFRRGGLIRGDRDGVLEPRTIEAHETEYVVRPEAVEAVGVEALDRLNRMGRNPGMARQSSGIAALDALSGMPRRRNRGLVHSRKLGRVVPMGEM